MKKAGFTLTEVLIAMGIFGVLMTAMTMFFIGNQTVATQQISSAATENNVRLALLRINEIVSQANYIYPAGQTLLLNGQSYTTDKNALAVLIPEGTTYCEETATDGETYCGFLFSVEDRSTYSSILGADTGTTGKVVAEHRITGMSWPQHTLPSLNWPTTNHVYAPVADSVSDNTSLGEDLEAASFISFDRDTFDYGLGTNTSLAKALIKTVNSTIEVSFTFKGQPIKTIRSSYILARAIPRGALPHPN